MVLEAQVHIVGRVMNETNAPIPGAKVVLSRAAKSFEGISDPTGAFAMQVPEPGDYSLKVDRQGFYLYSQPVLDVPAPTASSAAFELRVTLQTIYELSTSVEVKGQPGMVDMDRTTPETTLSSRTLYDIPFPDQNSLRSGLRLIPGLIQDSGGGIHLFGGSEAQAQYTFEGFQLNDPLTGRFDARMSLESVQSVDVVGSQSGAEYGLGAAGTMALHARSGGDEFQFSSTDIFPGFHLGGGVRVSDFTPRVNFSGPWWKGRAWFFNTAELQYVDTIVPQLPAGGNATHSWRVDDLIHNQVNITPRNNLFAGLLFNYFDAPHNGLTFLDPVETTVHRQSHEWFGYIKDQHSFSHSSLIEFGISASRDHSRDIPLGDATYLITPNGRTGDYYETARRYANREEALTNYFLPAFELFGKHQLKTGGDVLHLDYTQNIDRGDIDYIGLDGTVVRQVVFVGSGLLSRANYENSLYVQDSWRVTPSLLIEMGGRADHDQLLDRWNTSPRAGFSWSPPKMENTRLSAGFARIFDPTDLQLFTRPLDQSSISTYFDANGNAIYGPIASLYTIGPHVVSPRADIWNAGLERVLPKAMQAKVQWLRRRSTDGFDYLNSLPANEQLPAILAGAPNPGAITADYVLSNQREDHYDSVEFAVRQPLKGRFEWMVSYTRSSATSNAVLDRSVDQPLMLANDSGPLPWNAPNRLLSWGYVPLWRKNWALAYMLDWHSGLPFSVQDQYGQLVGTVDDYRFVTFFELNLFVERQLVVRGYRLAVRFGLNNITGHQNSNQVENVVGGPNFLYEYGGQSRAVDFRLRYLGKTKPVS
jgi:Carboxypeptidase regulatory-like domain